MLSTNDLRYIALRHFHTRDTFGGVFSADTLPTLLADSPIFYIVNTDKSNGIGLHWILISIPNSIAEIEWFDSLGKTPDYYHNNFLKFVTRNYKSSYLTNSYCVQSSNSDKCGYFCMYVADKRCMSNTYANIMKTFNVDNLSENDTLTVNYVHNHMM